MVTKMESTLEKVLVSVITSAIIASAAAGIGTWAEVKAMRLELTGVVEKQRDITEEVKEIEKRVDVLEVKCGSQK